MALNAFLTFFDKADGESIQKGHEKWVELQGWDWEVEADSSWTKGGGASVGKPAPGRLSCVHALDGSSIVALGYICTGRAFPKIQLDVTRDTGKGRSDAYFVMTMTDVYLTKVSLAASEEGQISQRIELIFKTVAIDYRPQDRKTGSVGAGSTFNWDIPAGTASPSA